MKSPYSFIVKPVKDKRYNNTIDINNIEFITSVSQEDHTSSNRFGEVISVPLNYKGDIQKGDLLLVHHNVFKYYYDMYGRQKSGKSYFKDDMFFIEQDQFFLYKRKDKWYTHDKYCFIKPILVEDSYIKKSSKYEPLKGKIVYSNKQLDNLGVKVNDTVIFSPDSEYEFNVDGQLLYRMFTNNITMIINE
mgnify:CR=1 FL=1|tara:strand:- start:7491 stop:8060 length:570 start_codon:yes stop_codon:yes gene_type:complete